MPEAMLQCSGSTYVEGMCVRSLHAKQLQLHILSQISCRGASSSGARAGWLVTARLIDDPRLLECRGVPWARHLTLTASDELAVALHGWVSRRCVNVCMNGWMSGNWEWGESVTLWYSVAILSLRLPSARWNPIEIIKVCNLFFVWFCDSELLLTSRIVEGNNTYDNTYVPDYLHCGTRIK